MAQYSEHLEERETHHNQALTTGAAARLQVGQGSKSANKKAVVLQLDERERAALAYLGGVKALKKLLCPADLCIKCRQKPSVVGTSYNSLCPACQAGG